MGHTLVGKAVLCKWKVLGSNPSGGNLQDSRLDKGHHGKISVFFFFFFLLCNSGRELARGCYALKHKYHLPCRPPPVAIFFANIHTAKMSTAMWGSF